MVATPNTWAGQRERGARWLNGGTTARAEDAGPVFGRTFAPQYSAGGFLSGVKTTTCEAEGVSRGSGGDGRSGGRPPVLSAPTHLVSLLRQVANQIQETVLHAAAAAGGRGQLAAQASVTQHPRRTWYG